MLQRVSVLLFLLAACGAESPDDEGTPDVYLGEWLFSVEPCLDPAPETVNESLTVTTDFWLAWHTEGWTLRDQSCEMDAELDLLRCSALIEKDNPTWTTGHSYDLLFVDNGRDASVVVTLGEFSENGNCTVQQTVDAERVR